MVAMGEKLTTQQVLDADLADWRPLINALHTRFVTKGFQTGLDLVNAIGAAAEEMNHHPDLDLRWGHLNVKLTSHDSHGLTERDVRLARTISELAAAAGVPARPDLAQDFELALDTPDFSRIRPFWKALLAAGDNPAYPDELVDAGGGMPTLWFQKSEPDDVPHQRFHLDVYVPHDLAEQRIADALAAGGTLVSADSAPSFTVLADADGNRVCVCTALPKA